MKKEFLILLTVQFFVYFGFGLIIPILPEVIVQHGYETIHMGGLLTVYALASFFTAPFWGAWSDRIGRKPLILIGLAGFAVSFLLVSLFMDSLPLLYASRAVGGLFSGALYTAVTGYVGDVTTEENRNRYMGLLGMSIGLGFIFGPAIGGALGRFGLAVPFTASAALLFALLLAASFVLKEPRQRGAGAKRRWLPEGAAALWSGRARYLFLLSFFITLLLAGLEATFQLFQRERIDITPEQIGYLFLFSGFVDAAMQGGVVRRIKDGAEPKWIFGAQLVTALGLLLISFSSSLAFAGFALCVFTAGNALARTALVSLTSKESGGRYGTAAGMTYSMDNLGRIIGPLLFTKLLTVHVDATYVASAAIALASTSLLLFFLKSKKGRLARSA